MKVWGYVSAKNLRNLRKRGWKLAWVWERNLEPHVSERRKASQSNGVDQRSERNQNKRCRNKASWLNSRKRKTQKGNLKSKWIFQETLNEQWKLIEARFFSS